MKSRVRRCGWVSYVVQTSIGLLIFFSALAAQAQKPAPPPNPQNPSPMVEYTRAHRRIPKTEIKGARYTLSIGTLFVPPEVNSSKPVPLVIHFHGAPWLAEWSAHQHHPHAAVISINLGVGSSVYAKAFQDPQRLAQLLEEASEKLSGGRHVTFRPIVLSSWSAGYGATREILMNRANWDLISGVVLVDGLHTSYVPEGTPGPLATDSLQPFVDFAKEAVAGRKQMIITHSEIFPGTFASTTETADYLLQQLGLKRRPVLRWGPVGMQQLSEVRAGKFTLMGFAGNSAPDHVDQVHGLSRWLKLWKER